MLGVQQNDRHLNVQPGRLFVPRTYGLTSRATSAESTDTTASPSATQMIAWHPSVSQFSHKRTMVTLESNMSGTWLLEDVFPFPELPLCMYACDAEAEHAKYRQERLDMGP